MNYDFLPNTDIKLKQTKEMFRMNTDTHLLGRFIKVKEEETVLDIGTNNGALLLYLKDKPLLKLVGIDYFPEAIEFAKHNFNLNKMDVELHVGDINDFTYHKVDVIVCNPPYFKYLENGNLNENEYLKVARHERFLTLEQLCYNYSRLIKDTGRIYMVHRASRIMEINTCLNQFNLKIKEMQLVFDENKELATSVLLEIVPGSVNQIIIKKPLIIRR